LKKIGLTGGIGSGKSYIAKIFEALAVPVFYADDEAKKILNKPEVLNEVSKALNESVFDAHSNLADRKKIASLVFNAPEKLKLLNQIIHPKVELAFKSWCEINTTKKYVIKEAAILFESEAYLNLDGVICVLAPIDLRLKRVAERDQIDEKEIAQRIKNQWTDEQRIAQSNWLIYNDLQHELLSQVLDIHHEISSK
jgi:dephospho-CoA kinase